jgi:hypothetical protein
MGLITDLEYVVLRYESKSGVGRLEVIDRLTHVSFGGKDQCSQTVVIVFDLLSAIFQCLTYILGGTNLLQSLHYFRISQLRVPQNRTS